MEDEMQKLGWKLVECSMEDDEFSKQRGLINVLFPYVYEASKRMSSRAISRWLESNGVKLSAVTIAKALRNPKPFWQELAEEFEPVANVFSNAHNISVYTVLTDENAFRGQAAMPPGVDGITRDGLMDSFNDIEGATKKLAEGWFRLPKAAREACLGNADLDLEEFPSPEGAVTEGTTTEAAAPPVAAAVVGTIEGQATEGDLK
jgi:hypothetical protein